MFLVVKDKITQEYFCGFNIWDKQIRKAKIYTSYKYAQQIREDSRYPERELSIFIVQIQEGHEYNPDLEV